jgi:undecaprenyl-diphosphatase
VGLIEAIVLGILQGVTEFIPISSTAHIRIAPELFGWPDPGAPFTAAIQLGSLVAIVLFFWRDLRDALLGWLRGLRGGAAARTDDARMGWAILIGTIPIVVLGLLFQDRIEEDLRSLAVIGWSLIAMAIVLMVAERVGSQTRKLQDVGIRDAVVVGLFQAIALIPGSSRSGSTIAGGLLFGMERATAARFSFLLSVPSILGAGVYSLVKHREDLLVHGMVPLLVANVMSFVFGYWSIGFLLRFLQRNSVRVFAYYRIVLGAVILALLQAGTLTHYSPVDAPGTPGQATPITDDMLR